MDSEVDLDEAVRQLQAVASAPELYPELVRLGAVPEIVNLLGHENGDLAASVAELLRELTDTDAVEDSVRPLPRFTHAWHHQPAAGFREVWPASAEKFRMSRNLPGRYTLL